VTSLGPEADRNVDLGHVLGAAAKELSHTFTLLNRGREPIGILGVTSGLPCCGRVDPITPTLLEPGQALQVRVTLRLSRVGPLRHWASVQTDRPDVGEILLTTLAEVHAPFRVEPLDESLPNVAPSGKVKLRMNAIACFEGSEEPGTTDMRGLSISVPGRQAEFSWEGASCRRTIAGDLIERIRPFRLVLKSKDQSGIDQAEMLASDSSGLRLTQQLRWKVTDILRVSPALFTVKRGAPSHRNLVLKGGDNEAFAIVGANCNVGGVSVSWRGARATSHVLDVNVNTTALDDSKRLGVIGIRTDLKAQQCVKIPVVIVQERREP
jgi:hypothetical protein